MKKILIVLSIFSMLILLSFKIINLKPSINTLNDSNDKINGIDISHHNNITDWTKFKNNIDFCFIKSSQGGNYKDPKFNSYWLSAKKHKIVRGAYHFFSPGVSAEKQFNNFKKRVKLEHGDLPPVLDVELKDSNMDEVNKWLELATEYYGVKPIVYTEILFFKVFMEGKIIKDYPIWIYVDNSLGVEPYNNNCILWQYSHNGKIDGVVGNVDLNLFLGNSSDFKSLLIK
jgi:lysozyme